MAAHTPIDFQTDARQSLSQLVSASAALVGELGQRPQKPADVVRALGLDRKLGWQLFQIATATDPMEAGAHLLSPASVRRLLEAADEAGVAYEVRNRLLEAFEACELLIERHAVDRASFALMAASAGDSPEAELISIADRRSAYRAQSRMLGMAALSSFKTFLFHPGDLANPFGDVISLRGTSEIVPLRAQLRWPITSAGMLASDEEELDHGSPLKPLPGCEVERGISLIEPFCSEPLPKVEHHAEADGSFRSDLILEGIGRTHAMTVVLGYLAPNTLERHKGSDDNLILANFPVRIPCVYCYLDVLVHRDLGWKNRFEPRVFNDSFGPGAPVFHREHDLLPVHSEVIRGAATRVTAVQPPIDRYQELLDWACSSVGWDLSEFEATRVVIEYPVMPSTLSMYMEL